MSLLPEVKRQEVIAGKLNELTDTTCDEVEVAEKSDFPKVPNSDPTILLIPSTNDSSVAPWTDHTTTWKPSSLETPLRKGGSSDNNHAELGIYGSSLGGRLFNNAETGIAPQVSKNKSFTFVNKSIRHSSPANVTPLKDMNRTPSGGLLNSILQDNDSDKLSPEMDKSMLIDHLQNGSPYFSSFTANPITTPSSNRGLFRYSSQDLQPSVTSKRVHPERDDTPWKTASSDDLMDVSWRYNFISFSHPCVFGLMLCFFCCGKKKKRRGF